MTPEQQQQLNELLDFKKSLEASASIPFTIDAAFSERLLGSLKERPLSAIDSPSGGATIDINARATIDEIITALENLGLIAPN